MRQTNYHLIGFVAVGLKPFDCERAVGIVCLRNVVLQLSFVSCCVTKIRRRIQRRLRGAFARRYSIAIYGMWAWARRAEEATGKGRFRAVVEPWVVEFMFVWVLVALVKPLCKNPSR